MLWKGGVCQLGRFVFLFTSMRARSFSLKSEFRSSSIKSKCGPMKKCKRTHEKQRIKPVKSHYGIGRYCDMPVSPTRFYLLCFKQTFLPIIWIFTEGEGDEIESRLSSEIFSTLRTNLCHFCVMPVIIELIQNSIWTNMKKLNIKLKILLAKPVDTKLNTSML